MRTICHPGTAHPGRVYSDWIDPATGHAVTAAYQIARGFARGVYTVTEGRQRVTFGVLTPTPGCRALPSSGGSGSFGKILTLIIILAVLWGGYSLYRHYRPKRFPGRSTSRG